MAYKFIDKDGNFLCRPANYSATDEQVNTQLTKVINGMNITSALLDEEITADWFAAISTSSIRRLSVI